MAAAARRALARIAEASHLQWSFRIARGRDRGGIAGGRPGRRPRRRRQGYAAVVRAGASWSSNSYGCDTDDLLHAVCIDDQLSRGRTARRRLRRWRTGARRSRPRGATERTGTQARCSSSSSAIRRPRLQRMRSRCASSCARSAPAPRSSACAGPAWRTSCARLAPNRWHCWSSARNALPDDAGAALDMLRRAKRMHGPGGRGGSAGTAATADTR